MIGAGIAKGIKAAFLAASIRDLTTARGGSTKLGTCTFAEIEGNGCPLVVVNAYTQFDTGAVVRRWTTMPSASVSDGTKSSIPGTRIKLPKIGAGLAGGNWVRIAVIIEEELDGEDVTIVEFAP